MPELKRLSDEKIYEIIGNVIHEFTSQGKLPSTADLDSPIAQDQLEADQKVELENRREMIEEVESYSGSYIDKRFLRSQFWQSFKKKWLGR